MNKNIKKFVMYCILCLMIIIPNNTYAIDNDVSFVCPKVKLQGDKLDCTISLKTSETKIKGIQLNYEFDKNLSYEDTISKNNWQLLSNNNEGMMAIKTDGTIKDETIANVSFLIPNGVEIGADYGIELKNIVLTDGEKDISIETKKQSVKILSLLDIVESIKLNNEDVIIKNGNTNYTFEVGDKSSVNLEIKLKGNEYSFKDNFKSGVIDNLEIGDNIKKITIKKDDIELVTLTFNIIRNGATSENIISNPKTGNKIIIPIVLLIFSTAIVIYHKKKINKELK